MAMLSGRGDDYCMASLSITEIICNKITANSGVRSNIPIEGTILRSGLRMGSVI